MKLAFYVELTARAGNLDLGQQHFWLPAKPPGTPVQLAIYPLNVPAWRITIKRLLRVTITLALKGTVSAYEVSD